MGNAAFLTRSVAGLDLQSSLAFFNNQLIILVKCQLPTPRRSRWIAMSPARWLSSDMYEVTMV